MYLGVFYIDVQTNCICGSSFYLHSDGWALQSPCKGNHPTKRGEKRKSPSQGLGSMVLHPLPMPLPPTIQPMRSITPPPPSQFRSLPQEGIAGEEPRPLKMCCGISVGNLGANLTAAAAVYEYTARCLRDFASNPNFGMKRFDSMRQKMR